MQRRSFIHKTGLAGVLAAGAAPAIVHAQATIRWRLASSFPAVARHHLRRRRGVRQEGRRDDRRQVPDLGACRRRADAGLRRGRRRAERRRSRSPTPRRTTSSARTRVFALGCAIPFGLNARQMTAWMYEGNGLKLMREFYAKYNIINFPGGNTGAQMGGWYPQGDQVARRHQGPEVPHRRLRRQGASSASAACRRTSRAARSTRRSRRARSTRPSGSGPYDDLKLGFNKVAPNYYYPGWWEGGPQLDFFINNKAWDGLSAEYKAIVEAAAAHAHVDMQAKYDARNPAALKQLVGQPAPSCSASRRT